MNRVILLELNELSPSLLDQFMGAGELPNFSRLFSEAECYVTDADCEVEFLEPWIQWVTVHTGKPYEEHKVFRLGQSSALQHPSLWDVVSKHGGRSWVCGSMNSNWDKSDRRVVVLPDPWSEAQECSPEALAPFYNFVRSNVQEHTNKFQSTGIVGYAKFLGFMMSHGMSLFTVRKAFDSLLKQVRGAPDRWKRATVLDWLQLDLFEHVYKSHEPDFATFFSNSTAHFQHRFWRYMDPQSFSLKPTNDEMASFGNAVLYAYKNHDALIGRILKIAGDRSSVILASALSQQPYTEGDESGGRRFYRLRNAESFPHVFKLQGVTEVSPVMSHQFYLRCESDELAKTNFSRLTKISFQGSPLFSLRLEGSNIFAGCKVSKTIDTSLDIPVEEALVRFGDVFYLADILKSGRHHPHGVLWLYRKGRQHQSTEKTLPLTSAANLILQEMGVATRL